MGFMKIEEYEVIIYNNYDFKVFVNFEYFEFI